MIYIPNDWLARQENMDAVHRILSDELYSEINLSDRLSEAIRRLRSIGENDIARKLENGEIKLPS